MQDDRSVQPGKIKRPGKVYLVGAGPGDPGLLTIKGKKIIENADVIIYDRLASPRLMSFAPPDAERIYVGKRIGLHAVSQEEINRLIVHKAFEGKTVCRLKGGDPFIFGRGAEEAQTLAQAGIPFEVVPGVTSAIAVPAYAGIPLTHRACTASVAFITGHRKLDAEEADVDWEGLAKGVGTLVFLMGMTNLPEIVKELIKYGRPPDTPAAVINWGTTPLHRSVIGTLKDIVGKVKDAGIKPPSIIVIGDVVKLKDEINWFESRPLLGKKILITRAREQASTLCAMLEEKGAYTIELPTIATIEHDDHAVLDEAISRLSSFDWVVFSSENAVQFFFKRLFSLGLDLRALSDIKIAAVGPGTTGYLASMHLKTDLMPQQDFKAEGLVEAFKGLDIKGRRVLIPRAEKARDVLPEGLKALGADVDVAVLYKTIAPEADPKVIEELKDSDIDVVVFTSSSTVKNFLDIVPTELGDTLLKRAAVACIGPITSKTARDLGFSVEIEPSRSTLDCLVAAIESYFAG
ncbi:MAG: uroporphyrinogen-III C-methyltransferase [Dissulfurimicrobium hydrothermale]|uniref:uroporphyrinogen-III C-methyltransferase n=2 Tax=Dissulfurimicrobium TaxID=1769732 RepID=UPI003C708E1E